MYEAAAAVRPNASPHFVKTMCGCTYLMQVCFVQLFCFVNLFIDQWGM